jgi:hypothetical protein
MTSNGHTPPSPGGGGQGSTVAGLAREVEQLQRRLAELAHLPGRVDRIGSTVTDLAATITATDGSGGRSQVAPSWLDPDAPDPAAEAEDILTRLAGWIGGVYLRYSDAKLPECWLWHPDVVEELLWLHAAWIAAYHPEAPVTAVGDWHDRQRPGVVARINAYTGVCGLDEHLPGRFRHKPEPAASTSDAIPAIAAWWATARTEPPPAPTEQQIATARAASRTGPRR